MLQMDILTRIYICLFIYIKNAKKKRYYFIARWGEVIPKIFESNTQNNV